MFPMDLFTKGKGVEMTKENLDVQASAGILRRLKKMEANSFTDQTDDLEREEKEEVNSSALFLDDEDKDIVINQQEEGAIEDQDSFVKPVGEIEEKYFQNEFEKNENNEEHEQVMEEYRGEKSLLSIIFSLKAEKKESESKIKQLTEEKETIKMLESNVTQELDQVKKEKDDLWTNMNSLKETQAENEKEIKKLMEDTIILEELKAKAEKSDKIIKEMVKIIGLKTDDLDDSKENAFAENCLNRLKEQIEGIAEVEGQG